MTTIIAALLIAIFLVSGTGKVFAVRVMRANAAHLGFTVNQFRALGLLEIAGAAGVGIGLVFWPLGVAAATGVVLMMLGAARAHYLHRDPPQRVAAPLLVTAAVGAYLIALI